MLVRVYLFAMLKEALGEWVELEVPSGANAQQLLEAFAQTYPHFAGLTASLQVAVEHTYVPPEHPILPGQEVALIPPVSGG